MHLATGVIQDTRIGARYAALHRTSRGDVQKNLVGRVQVTILARRHGIANAKLVGSAAWA